MERLRAMTKETRTIFISPHFDDAILSCYPLIRECIDEGRDAEIWTIMAGMPGQSQAHSPVSMELSKHDPETCVGRRIQEDAQVCRDLSVPSVHLPFTDAIYRFSPDGVPIYSNPESLFHHVDLRELPLVNQIHDALLERLTPTDLVVTPSARCGHVDHTLCRVACEMLPNKILFYDEFPYYIRNPSRVEPEVLSDWERLIRMYASQVDILFRGQTLPHLLSLHGPGLYPLPQKPPKIPRKIHLIWIGGSPVPPDASSHAQAWKRIMGDVWQVKLWTDEDLNEVHFSRAILDRIKQARHGVQKADILRYQVMQRHGGWYFDIDFEPVQSIEPISRLLGHETMVLCHQDENLDGKLSNGFFGCSEDHPAMSNIAKRVLNQPLNTGDFDMGQIVTHTGPVFFYAGLQGSPHILLPNRLFYPASFGEITQTPARPPETHFARHIWHSRYLDHMKRFYLALCISRLKSKRRTSLPSPRCADQ
jgi:hypothetical protein